MSNEELAVMIKAGNHKCINVLWEQVEKFAMAKARDYFYLHQWICAAAGITIEDLEQESYFGFLDAIRYYEQEKDLLFISYMGFPLQNAFNRACCRRTKQARENPLNNSKSLNMPVGDDDVTLEDLILDETSEDGFRRIEDLDYQERLHNDLEACICELEPDQQDVIRCHYFCCMTIKDIAEKKNIQEMRCQSIENNAMRKLRSYKNRMKLQKYKDDIILRYGYKSSYSLWKEKGTSSTEYAAIKRENAEENWKKRSGFLRSV